jgi:signal transduction histidine kinase
VARTVAGGKKGPQLSRPGEALRSAQHRLAALDLLVESLVRFVEEASAARDADEVARLLLETVVRGLGFSRASLYLASHDSTRLARARSLGLEEGAAGSNDLAVDCGFVRWLSEGGGTVHIDEYFTESGEAARDDEETMRPLVDAGLSTATALLSRGRLLGALLCGGGGDPGVSAAIRGEHLAKLARLAAVALDAARAAEALAISRSEREGFSNAKRSLAERASEELRMPLALLKSTLWSLEPEEIDEGVLVDMARDLASRVERKASDLLALSGLEAEGVDFKLERSEVSSMVEGLLREMLPELEEREVRVDLDDRARFRKVLIDPAKVALAARSLLDRALGSVGRGGSIAVTIDVSKTPPGDDEGIEIGGPSARARQSRGASFLVLGVTDDGIGITPDELRALAGRREAAGAAEGAGPGAGLVVSQKIAAGHGGMLFCRSELGSRTRLALWLPIEA